MNRIDEFRTSLILSIAWLWFAWSFLDWRIGLIPLGVVCVHKLGHVLFLAAFKAKWALRRNGISADMHSLDDGAAWYMIYFGGATGNLVAALAAILIQVLLAPRHNYLLIFANLSALACFVSLIPVGVFSDAGRYLKHRFTDSPLISPRAILALEVTLSIVISVWMLGNALNDFTLNVVVSLLWANARMAWRWWHEENSPPPHLVIKSRRTSLLLLYVVVMAAVAAAAVARTPFFFSRFHLLRASLALQHNASEIGQLLEIIGLMALILLPSMLLHEFGHLAAAKFAGFPIRRLVIGHPGTDSKPARLILAFRLGAVRVEVYPLLILAAVDMDLREHNWLALGGFWQVTAFSLAGPLMTFALVLVGAAVSPNFSALGQALITVNLLLLMLNLLPLPGLDGGWPVINLVIKVYLWFLERNGVVDRNDRAGKLFHVIYEKLGRRIPGVLTVLSALYLLLTAIGLMQGFN